VIDIFKFRKTFLRKIKAAIEGDRSGWQRFVMIRLKAKEALPMSPRLASGATLLLDRHYNSLRPYRKNDSNLYAVLKNDTCAVRYVEATEHEIILRPHNQSQPIEVIPVASSKHPADYIVGRVTQIALEA
jgi:hypothetical protein